MSCLFDFLYTNPSYTNQSFGDDVLTIRRGSLEGKDGFLLQKEDKVIVGSETYHKLLQVQTLLGERKPANIRGCGLLA